jgi:hypothetical protein
MTGLRGWLDEQSRHCSVVQRREARSGVLHGEVKPVQEVLG